MGAEVIKIERPGTGDIIRKWDSAVRGLSSGYVWLNRNKRSLSVDVKKEIRPLVISDDREIPETYWKPQDPKLDR